MIINTQIKGAGGSSGKYQVLDRVKDDSNNEIGTVCGFFTDANDVEYAVVVLDAKDRSSSGKFSNSYSSLAIKYYVDLTVWSAKETATTNCDAILSVTTSSAVTHCRSKSYTINGNVYFGQLPNISELVQIFFVGQSINNLDPTTGSYSSLVIPTNQACWSSTYGFSTNAWFAANDGRIMNAAMDFDRMVIPILEIPNA